MAAPAVQDITQIMAELDPAYAQSRNLYNQQIGTVDPEVASQVAGLDQAKTNAFSDIAKSANTRGLDFWGIPIEEQQTYVGEKYLPARAAAVTAGQQRKTTLQQALAQLEQEKYLKAFERRSGQESARSAYESSQAELAWKARQADLDRGIEREKIAASNRGNQITQAQVKQADAAALAQQLSLVTGNKGGTQKGDNYVSPTKYAEAKKAWVNNGYSAQEFDTRFANFRNPNNRYYQVG